MTVRCVCHERIVRYTSTARAHEPAVHQAACETLNSQLEHSDRAFLVRQLCGGHSVPASVNYGSRRAVRLGVEESFGRRLAERS